MGKPTSSKRRARRGVLFACALWTVSFPVAIPLLPAAPTTVDPVLLLALVGILLGSYIYMLALIDYEAAKNQPGGGDR